MMPKIFLLAIDPESIPSKKIIDSCSGRTLGYDIAVAMLSFTMFYQDENRNMLSISGISFQGEACQLYAQRTNSVAITHDRGAFGGINAAAHEIGHLIGGYHDGTDGNVCLDDWGHIMTVKLQRTSYSGHWFVCSLKQFTEFFRRRNITCLHDKPKTLVPMPRVLTGRLLTMDEQCKKLEGTKSCMAEGDGRMQLRCFSKENQKQCLDPLIAAADSTICDTGKICLYGQCLSETEISERYTR